MTDGGRLPIINKTHKLLYYINKHEEGRPKKMTLEQRVTELESNVTELMGVLQKQQEAMQIQTKTIKDLQQIIKAMNSKRKRK